MQKVIKLSDLIVVHDPKHPELHFARPRMGIEEDMNDAQLVSHIKSKFRRWGVK